MRKTIVLLLIIASVNLRAQEAIVIDHNCLNLEDIPSEWIDNAKTNLYIGYGHTSHGSQITSGMNAVEAYYTDGNYDWSHTGGEGELHLFEGDGYGDGYLDHDCGYTGWDTETREYLDLFPECNVIMWSWCGQVNSVDVSNHYLLPMNQLETDYPDVAFVYMTGHLEGLGPDGSLFVANQEIRDYCNTNNKILFDFADIEKYSPDCDTNYQEFNANDACNYNLPQGGTANWAENWLLNNPDNSLAQISQLCGSCAHSVSLNCVKKGIASWFLWARIAGWEPDVTGVNNIREDNKLNVYPNPFKNEIVVDFKKQLKNPCIIIVDTKGEVVYNKQINGFVNTFNISDLNIATGVYIIQIYDETDQYMKKLIKY